MVGVVKKGTNRVICDAENSALCKSNISVEVISNGGTCPRAR